MTLRVRGNARIRRFGAATLGLFVLALLGAVPAFATEIFIVASYHREDLCGRPQQEAAVEALRQSGIPGVVFREYYLDSRRRDAAEVDGDIGRIIGDIRASRPALVLTIDDPAFSGLYAEVARLPYTFLVFTGLNRSVKEYDEKTRFLDERGCPCGNITGVFEHLFMKEQLEMLEVLLRRPIRRVAVLHSTDPVGMILKEQIESELAATQFGGAVVYFGAEDSDAVVRLADTIGRDPEIDAWIPATLSVRRSDGKGVLTMSDLAEEMMSLIPKPDLTLNVSFTELGFYGGVSVDFRQMGFQAGIMAAKLLKGYSIREIPVENARKSLVAINRSRMRSLGIPFPSEFSGIVDIFVK